MKRDWLKLISIVLVSSLLVLTHDIIVVAAVGFMIFLLVVFSGKQEILIERLRFFIFITTGIMLFQLLGNTDTSIQIRIITGAVSAFKIIILSVSVFWFTITTSPSGLVAMFSFMPQSIRLMLVILFSLIPLIQKEARDITIAQKARGLHISWFAAYRGVIPVIIPLLHRTLARAEQLSLVLHAYGYETKT